MILKKKITRIYNTVKSVVFFYMISLKYVFRKVYVILNVRDSYMCVNVFEVKIVKSVWKRVSSEFEK